MDTHVRWIIAALLALGTLLAGWPTSAALAQEQRCFDETTTCARGRILSFWEANGGLAVFGYPITEQHIETIEGRAFEVQWFERARLELHPENPAPQDVLLGRLGVERLQQQGRDWQTFPKSGLKRPDCHYFAETQHAICPPFLAGWLARGIELDRQRGYSSAENLAFLGLPLSDAQQETIDGTTLQVQWFERGRLEYHPENKPPYDILGGLLGSEVYDRMPSPLDIAASGHIAYLAPDGVSVKQTDADGEHTRTLFTITRPRGMAVTVLSANPAGSAFVYAVSNDTSGFEYTLVQNGASKPLGTFSSQPRWAPDGNSFVLQRYGNDQGDGAAVLYNVRTHTATELPFRGTPDWFADGKRLVYVAHLFPANGNPQQSVRVYNLATRSSTILADFGGAHQSDWLIQEAHVLPGDQQIVFYGGRSQDLGASGNGMQWWWIPASGGTPAPFDQPDGNGVAAYAASPNGEWIASATQAHSSACASDGTVTLQTSDVRGGVAVGAPLVLPTDDQHLYVNGLSWEPKSNYVAIGAHTYACPDGGGGDQQNLEDAIYVWKIRLIGQNGAILEKIANGSLPVWVR